MNPYASALGAHDPVETLAATPARLRAVIDQAGPAAFSASLGPGKWTVEQLLVHLLQAELVFYTRYRFALTSDSYVVQPFEQDGWMNREPVRYGADVLEALQVAREFNLPLVRSLTPAEKARPFVHPERGALTVGTLVETHAGHDLHHLAQIEAALR
jgi:uncharacterized damage-inducible protein DinB